MLRRPVVLLAMSALVVAGLGGVNVVPAHAARVPASGAISCDWINGTARFDPAFLYGGTTPASVRFHGRVRCRSGLDGSDTAPFGIRGANVRGSMTVPRNQCGGSHFDGGPGHVTLRWIGDRRVLPTDFSTAASFWQFDFEGTGNSGKVVGLPGDHVLGGTATGSFAGHAGMVMAGSSPATGNACRPKSNDLPGSGGVKRFVINAPGGTILFLP